MDERIWCIRMTAIGQSGQWSPHSYDLLVWASSRSEAMDLGWKYYNNQERGGDKHENCLGLAQPYMLSDDWPEKGEDPKLDDIAWIMRQTKKIQNEEYIEGGDLLCDH